LKNLQYGLYFLILLFISCASLPPEVPQSENSSILAIAVNIRGRITAPYPDTILLIKLNGKDNSYFSDETVLRSNFQNEGRYYFLNAEPGRYIAIGAFRSSESGNSVKERPDDYTYYFPAEMVQSTDTEFKNGESVFMGEYVTRLPFNFEYGIKNPDESQLYYCKRLQPNKADPSTLGCCIETFIFIGGGTGENAEALKLEEKSRDNKSEIKFWMKAKEDFKADSLQKFQDREIEVKNALWQNIIDRKLKKLNGE